MRFNYVIEKIKKININQFKEFLKNQKITENITIEDNNTISKIIINDHTLVLRYYKCTDDHKEFNNRTIEDILNDCYTTAFLIINNEEEIKVGLYLMLFFQENTNIIFYNNCGLLLDNKEIKDLTKEDVELLIKENQIHLKYYQEIEKRKEIIKNYEPIKSKPLFIITLIIGSVIASLLLIYMILSLKITNAFILVLPIVLVLIIHLINPIKSLVIRNNKNKEINNLNYKKSVEISNLYNERVPKEPSINKKIKNFKQLIINICGIMIVPAMIIGSILLTFDYIILGIIILLLPWIVLILIKTLITDKDKNNLINNIIELTDKLLENDINNYIGINYLVKENGKHTWEIKLLGYKAIKTKNINKNNNNNIMEELDNYKYIVKYNGLWEEIEKTIINTIIIKYNYKFKDIKNIQLVSVRFEDGIEKIIYNKE